VIGETLNHYEVLRKLGSGGMGEVFVARDEKLGRDVALKVLPAELSLNAEARNRFAREAKAVAALNHPGIVTLFSIEEADGVHFTTMELVHGKTLAELIGNKGLTLEQVFDIAIPLADAVSAAHQQGITHRDLKPQNVMVTDEGSVKVLDFGLAKLQQEIPGKAMTQLDGTVATGEGRILGTVAYMSPEQAQGLDVDTRTDIFAMGVLLYEMATGERPFKGDTGVSIVSSILKDTPVPVTDVNRRLPRHLGRIVKHCLQKDPERRFQTALDLRNDLEELKSEIESGELQTRVTGPEPVRGMNRLALAGGALLLVAVAFFVVQRLGKGESGSVAPLKVSLQRLTSQPGAKRWCVLAPDGKTVAYAWEVDHNWDIYVQRVGGDNPIKLTHHEAEDKQPAFSPDGEQIVFRSGRDGGGLFLMGATGESLRRLTDKGHHPGWSPDGSKVVFTLDRSVSGASKIGPPDGGGVWTVDVASGEIRQVYDGSVSQPRYSPHGHRIAFWGLHGGGRRDIATIPAGGGKPVLATDQPSVDWNPVWAPDGRHLYFLSNRGGSENLWRVPVDERSGKPTGEPEAITRGGANNRWHASISADGRRIAFADQIADAHVWRTRLDEPKPERVTSGSMYVFQAQVSPDGERLAMIVWGPRQRDLFVSRADGSERRQLTDDNHKEWWPIWSPDSEQIAFRSDRSGQYEIWVIRPDGSGLRQVTETPNGTRDAVWSPDGSILYTDRESGADMICDATASRSPGEPVPKFREEFAIGSWSPNERLLAGSERSGIVIFSFETRKYEKVIDIGQEPRWLSDSRRLVFHHKRKIWLLDVQSKETQEIVEIDSRISSMSVTSDDRWVYFRRYKAQGDIWLATLE
jgi:Tol biopolymer transport system component